MNRMVRVTALGATVALVCGWPAYAQWDPGATQQLGMGYGESALSQSALRNAADIVKEEERAKGRQVAKAADDDYAGSGMSRSARLASLEAEYLQRVANDGVESAKAWAFEMGRRDAIAR